ncbi:unnamed protein product [Caenorhabditis brenneri]
MLYPELCINYTVFFLGLPLILLLPIVHCSSKKKFETDGRAELVPRNYGSHMREKSSSKQAPPTAQTPPSRTPVEKTGTMEEDTLANVKTLPLDKSEAPTENDEKDKKKKKKK